MVYCREGIYKPQSPSKLKAVGCIYYFASTLVIVDATAKSPKNAAKTHYLPVRQHRQRSKIEGAKYF